MTQKEAESDNSGGGMDGTGQAGGDESSELDASEQEGAASPKVLDAPEEAAEPLRNLIDRRECRVLKADALDQLEHLSAALVRAENRARQIVEEAQREAESIRKEAREEGRREGYEELLPKITEVRERYRQIQDEAEEDTLELAFRVARRIVGRELQRDPSVVRDIVDNALERVRGKRHVVIRANPEDVEELEGYTDAFSKKLEGAAVYVEEDQGIERGGCVLETDTNRVDARLGIQLERLREVLTGD